MRVRVCMCTWVCTCAHECSQVHERLCVYVCAFAKSWSRASVVGHGCGVQLLQGAWAWGSAYRHVGRRKTVSLSLMCPFFLPHTYISRTL